MHSTFSELKKLSIAALSKQLPVLLMLQGLSVIIHCALVLSGQLPVDRHPDGTEQV